MPVHTKLRSTACVGKLVVAYLITAAVICILDAMIIILFNIISNIK